MLWCFSENITSVVLPLAVEYQIQAVVDKCEQHLIRFIPDRFDLDEKTKLCPKSVYDVVMDLLRACPEINITKTSHQTTYWRYGGFSQIPWWSVLVTLYYISECLDLPVLKKVARERLMTTNRDSVWCSAAVEYCGSQAARVSQSKASVTYTYTKFALRGVRQHPCFTMLGKQEQIDILLSYAEFEDSCRSWPELKENS